MSELAAKNDLPAQLTEALRAAARRCDDTCGEDCTHVAITAEHDDGRIVYVEASPDAIVAAFAGVRDELVAHLSARVAEAEAKVEHAEAGAQLSSDRLAKVRQELAEAYNLSGIRAKLLREAWDAHHDTMDDLDSLRRKLTAKEAEADGLNRDRDGWRTRANEAEAGIERVSKWVTSDVVTAKSSFGDGYREAQRDIRDLMTAPVEGTTTPARETA